MVLRLFLLLIYINDLTDVIQRNCKIFADGMFLFSKCQDFKKSKVEIKRRSFYYQKVDLPMKNGL